MDTIECGTPEYVPRLCRDPQCRHRPPHFEDEEKNSLRLLLGRKYFNSESEYQEWRSWYYPSPPAAYTVVPVRSTDIPWGDFN